MTVDLLNDPVLLLAALAILVFAGLVHGTLGLGFPMVATPMLAVFTDVRSAILITLLPTVAVNVVTIWRSPGAADSVRQFMPLTVSTLIGSLIGAWVLAIADPSPFRLVLGCLILLYLWTTFSGQLPRHWLEGNALFAMVGFGLAAGLSGGTTNVMVAILIIYFLSLNTPRATMVPVLNSCFLIGKVSQIAVLSVAGFVSLALMTATAPLALAAVLALLAGQRIQAGIDVTTYRRILYGLLAALALTLFVQFFLY